MSAESDYLEWRKKPQVGCVFARLLASRYSDYPQHIQTVPTGRSPERIAADVAQRIEALVANPDVTATTLLFPDVESLEHTAQIMLAFDRHATASTWDTDGNGSHREANPFWRRNLSLRGANSGTISGVSADPASSDHGLRNVRRRTSHGGPEDWGAHTKANLAHIEMNLPSHNAFETMWKKTIEGRKRSLGGDDNRAKAKISFVIPLGMARRLGCAP
jgi:hypothetical protein